MDRAPPVGTVALAYRAAGVDRAAWRRGDSGRRGPPRVKAPSNAVRLSTPVRLVVVAAFVALSLGSIALTLPDTVGRLRASERVYGDLSAARRATATADSIPLPRVAFDFYRERLAPGDRFYVQVPPLRFGVVGLPAAVTYLANFELLPATQVVDPRAADVILSFAADPRALGLSYRRVERFPGAAYFVGVAEVARER